MAINSTINRGWAAAFVWGVVLFSSCGLAAAAGFTIDSTAGLPDASKGTGFCADATGACTLRAVIGEANALAGDDTITLPGGTFPIGSQLTVDTTISISGAGEGPQSSRKRSSAPVTRCHH